MLFRLRYGKEESYSSSNYDAWKDIKSFLFLIGFMFAGGIMVFRYLAFPAITLLLFIAFVCLFPLPVNPLAFHLVFIPTLCLVCESIFATGFRRGFLIGLLALIVSSVLMGWLWFRVGTLSTEDSLLVGIDIIALFLFLFVGWLDEIANVRFTVLIVIGAGGVILAIADTVRLAIKDKGMRQLLYVCAVALVIGCMPVVVMCLVDIESSTNEYSILFFALALILCYAVLSIVCTIIARVLGTFRVINCAPLLVPLLVSLTISVLGNPNLRNIYDNSITKALISFSKNVDPKLRLAALTDVPLIPRWFVALFWALAVGEIVFLLAEALSGDRKKQDDEQ